MQILSILGCCGAATMLVAASDRLTVVTQSSCGGNRALVMQSGVVQTGQAGAEAPVKIMRKVAGHVHIQVSDPYSSSIIDQSEGVTPDASTRSPNESTRSKASPEC